MGIHFRGVPDWWYSPFMKSKPRMIAALPTLLTLGNAACGFGAITVAAKLGPEHATGVAAASPDLLTAGLLVFAAMLFDVLDGSAARLTNSTSDIGAQLDSLCDAISFGVAPAFIMLQFVRHDHALANDFPPWFTYPSRFLWTIGALYVVSAVLRLARFNVETDEDDAHDGFSGLPSPAAAALVVSFPFAMRELIRLHEKDAAPVAWLVPAIVALMPVVTLMAAALMVSKLPYAHVFTQMIRGEWRRREVIGLVFAAGVVFWIRELAAVVLFAWFAFTPPTKALFARLRNIAAKKSKQPARV